MERVRFLHIPKTAGTTITSILHRQYQRKKIFSFSGDITADIRRFGNLSEFERENIELFEGHAPIMTGVNEADSATLLTFLRDPVERVKSFCQHVSEGKSPYLIGDFPPESFNLDRFLDSGNAELSNLQTKMLINTGESASPVLINAMSASVARDTALDNLLNKISQYGIQEYFDESLLIISTALNWKLPLYISRNRKSCFKRIKFEPSHLAKIAELNSIDIDVYKGAKERFLALMNSETFDNGKLKHYRLVNKLLGGVVVSISRLMPR